MSDTPQTADPEEPRVLARMIAAHQRQAATARDRTDLLSGAWHRALRHAAVPFKGLDLVPGTAEVKEHVALGPALEDLPDNGLIAVLEDREGARGLIVLSHGTIDALVEVQTTGRVDPRELPPRPVTRIDEALCRDFLDLALAAFSREAQAIEDRDWPQRMNFGSRIADPRQLTLLLADRVYHRISAGFSLGDPGERNGMAVLVLPRTRAPLPRATGPDVGMSPEAWATGMEDAMSGAPLRLDAVLMRTTRSLGELEALAPGDLIAFEPSVLSSVTLETPGGRMVMRGRLGQMGGLRALRMTEGLAQGAEVEGTAIPGGAMAARADLPGATELPGHADMAGPADPPGTPDLPGPLDMSEPPPGFPAPMDGAAMPSLADPGVAGVGEAGLDPPAQSGEGPDASGPAMPRAAPLDIMPTSVPIDPNTLAE